MADRQYSQVRRGAAAELRPIPRWQSPLMGARAVANSYSILLGRAETASPIAEHLGWRRVQQLTRATVGAPKAFMRTTWNGLFGHLYAVRGSDAFVNLKPLAKRGPLRTGLYVAARTVAGVTAAALAFKAMTAGYDLTSSLGSGGRLATFVVELSMIEGGIAATMSSTPFSATGRRLWSSTRRALRKSDEKVWELRAISAATESDIAYVVVACQSAATNHSAKLIAEAVNEADRMTLKKARFNDVDNGNSRFVVYVPMAKEDIPGDDIDVVDPDGGLPLELPDFYAPADLKSAPTQPAAPAGRSTVNALNSGGDLTF